MEDDIQRSVKAFGRVLKGKNRHWRSEEKMTETRRFFGFTSVWTMHEKSGKQSSYRIATCSARVHPRPQVNVDVGFLCSRGCIE